MKNLKVSHIDCLKGLTSIRDRSIKTIVTSPPYKTGDGYSRKLIENVAKHTKRVLKNDGVAFINFAQLAESPQRHHEVALIFGRHLKVGPEIVWVKSMPELGGQFTPIHSQWWMNRKHEWIFVFGKDDSTLDRLAVGIPYRDKGNLKRFNHKTDLQCPGDVWFIPYTTRNGPKTHPDEMPSEVARRCISLSGVRSGDTILDPFCGSGTTGVAAHLVGPRLEFIGFDQNEEHVATAKARFKTLIQ